MIVYKAFRFRLKSNDKLESFYLKTAGCCRFVWNKALALQIGRLEIKENCITYYKMSKELKIWKREKETDFLKEVHSQPLQQSLMDLGRAIREASNKRCHKQFPKFKKKGYHDSFRYPQGFKFDSNRVFLPKIGWATFFKSREIKGKSKNITVSRNGNKWFLSVQVEIEITDPIHPSSSMVGIDMGINRFATLSDGSFIKPLSSFCKLKKVLAREQRKLSRKVKFSKNWNKQKEKVSNIYIKIADSRKDFLHKASTTISKNHAVVVLEDLRISNMIISAKRLKTGHDRNVRALTGLNRAILDQGWYEFRRQLEYKEGWLGGNVISVPPQYTSQTCPVCGCVTSINRRSRNVFLCNLCGYKDNAYFVAAKNILAAGHAVSACGDTRAIRLPAQETPLF